MVKILFIINPHSGHTTLNRAEIIKAHFETAGIETELVEINDSCSKDFIRERINVFKPQRVAAVGGDGTVKLAAECLLDTNIPLGIVPAGSANGMAKELGIPTDLINALDLIIQGQVKKIHLVKINEQLCIHLSDIGFNAFVIKKFETERGRGMWGYIKASWKVLWQQPHMEVAININGQYIKRKAAMIVIANATKYGSGALINPSGKLDDEVFEVILVKKISLTEIYKMMVSHLAFDPTKTEVYQTASLEITSRRKAHFQVDGEYLGKINNLHAGILPAALQIVVP